MNGAAIKTWQDRCNLSNCYTKLDNVKAQAQAMHEEIMELRAALAVSQKAAEPVKWPNGCDRTVPAALRYLADNPRPSGGEEHFNSAHLYQLAREIERMAAMKLYAAPAIQQPHWSQCQCPACANARAALAK